MLISFKSDFVDKIAVLKTNLGSLCSLISAETKDTHVIQDVNEIASKLQHINPLIEDQYCKLEIVVAGQFNSGKSTFINALLGSEVALTSELEMTYSASFITYGASSKNVIHYKDNSQEELQIEDLLSKLSTEKNNSNFKDNLKHIEIFSDNSSLEDVNVWDSPGFGSTTTENELVALRTVESADVLLWVFDIGLLGDQNEVRYIRSLRAKNYKIVGIFNKIDSEDIPLDSLDQVRGDIDNIYGDIFEEVFFVSSLNDLTNIHKVSDYLRDHHIKKKYEYAKASKDNQLLNFITSLRDKANQLLSYLNASFNKINAYKADVVSLKNGIDEKLNKHINDYENSLFADESALALNDLLLLSGKEINEQKVKEIINLRFNEESIKKTFQDFCSSINDFLRDRWRDDLLLLNDEYSFQFRIYEIDGVIDLTNDVNGDNIVWKFIDQHFPEKIEVSAFAGLSAGAAVGALTAFSVIDAAFTGGLITLMCGICVKKLREDKKRKLVEDATAQLNSIMEDYTQSFMSKVKERAMKLNEGTCNKLLESFHKENAVFDDSFKSVNTTKTLKSTVDLSNEIVGYLRSETDKLPDPKKPNNREPFIIYHGDSKKGLDKLLDLLIKSRSYVYIVDPYFSVKSVDYLKYIPTDTSVMVLLANIDNDMYEYKKFVKSAAKINSLRDSKASFLIVKIKYNNKTPLHDRYVFSEDWAIKMGNSFDAIGHKDVGVSFISDLKKDEFQDSFFQKFLENRESNVCTHPIHLG